MPYKWPADTDFAFWELDVLDRDGPACGRMMHICDHRYRRLHTLEGPVQLVCKLNHCPDRDCPGHATTKSPEQEATIAPPNWRREKGSSLNSASLTPKPLASSVYVHVPEAPSPFKRSMSVTSLLPSPGLPELQFPLLERNRSAVGTTASSLVSPRRPQLTPLPCGGLARLDRSLEPRRSAVLISALATGPPAGVGGELGPFLSV